MSGWRSAAWAIFAVLTAINFLNYIDQMLLSAVLEPIKAEFALNDTEGGLLGSIFVVVYMLASPLGYFGDRLPRKWIVAGGVLLWSLATLAAGFARSYHELLVCRALLGVGEAAYATIAPSIIADLYGKDERSRKFALFYIATPVGSALGYVLGGFVGAHWGWRSVFLVGGLPGLVFAGLVALLREPARGGRDEPEEASAAPVSLVAAVSRIVRTPAWRTNTIGLAMMTFTVGGLALWMPAYLQRVHKMALEDANLSFGALSVAAGIVGTIVGGRLGDRLQARSAGGYFWLSGLGLVFSAPFLLLMTLVAPIEAVFAAGFVAMVLLFLNTGPLNAALVASVPPSVRGTAFAANILCIHAFGDALSRTLIGVISDEAAVVLGSKAAGLNFAVATTALPVLIGGLVLLRGARRIARAPQGLMTYPG